jgi:Predicted ABC-type transport system involved in lysophospholipase L1 biosynthesis, permease component
MKRYWQDAWTASLWFWRGLKRGDWVWLLLAVVIASASVTFVEQLGKTVKDSMLRQAANDLGADYVLRSSRPIDDQWTTLADELDLETAQTETLVTMALSGERFQLVRLKGVSPNYPLRNYQNRFPTLTPPDKTSERPNVWVESALMPLMQLQDDSIITLGKTEFALGGTFQPLGAAEGMGAFSHQMVIPLADMAATELKGPGSRVEYELALIGTPNAIERFADAVDAEQNPHLQSLSAQAPSQDLAQSLDTAWLFLELSALSAVLVAGLSILIASRFYLQRWQNSIALMRAFGAQRAQMTRLFAFQLSWLAIIASGVGVALGAGLFQASLPLLWDYFDPLVPAYQPSIYVHGFLMGFLVLWSFAWQAYRHAVSTSPMQLLKNLSRQPQMRQWLVSLGLILLVVMLMTGYVWWVLVGLVAAGVVLYLAALGLLRFVGWLQRRSRGWLKLSLAALLREPGLVKIQLISMGLVLFVLMLMTFVRHDLMANWQASLPANTPDTFIVNVQPDQKDTVQTVLKGDGIETNLVPMARGRLVAVNDEPIRAQEQESNRARRLLERESNIAVLETPPAYNEMLAESEPKHGLPQVSLEEGMAELFGLQLNDVLTFSFSGQDWRYEVTSIRKVQWQSFRLNFFFIVQPETDRLLPISYIGNFALADRSVDVNALTQQLAQQAPGVLLIDARRILTQVQTIMSQASWAVSGLYGFTLLASLIVLFTATMASQQTRVQSWLLLRTLGATQRDITKIGLMEFILLGALAGLLAATFAQLAGLAVNQFVLEVSPEWNPELWVISVVSGAMILWLIGWLTQKRYLRLSPRRMAQKWSD